MDKIILLDNSVFKMMHRRRRLRISPADVKFTQESIAMSFQDEDRPDLNSTCEKIAKKELEVSSIRTIRVVNINGIYNR